MPTSRAHAHVLRFPIRDGFVQGLWRDNSTPGIGSPGEERCRLKWWGTPFSTPVRARSSWAFRDGHFAEVRRRPDDAASVKGEPPPFAGRSKVLGRREGQGELLSWNHGCGRCRRPQEVFGATSLGLFSPTLMKEPAGLWWVRSDLCGA